MADNELKISVTTDATTIKELESKIRSLRDTFKSSVIGSKEFNDSALKLKNTLEQKTVAVRVAETENAKLMRSYFTLGENLRKNTNPAFVSFNQIVQDAPFGIRGVGNNIQFLTQQFTQLRSQGMTTGEILKGMVQNALTPMGALMFAVSAGTSLLTVAMDMLGSKTASTTAKQKDLNAEFQNQSDILFKLGEISRKQRISDLEMGIAKAQADLDALSKSEKDFQATVIARTKDPNAVAVYRVIGTPEQFKDATTRLRNAQLALKEFISQSEPKESKRSRQYGGMYGYQPFDNGQSKALFNIDQRARQLEDEGKKYQMQQAEELAQIREDAEIRSLKKTEDNLRSAMNAYNSIFFSPLKAGFDAIATGSGNMADAFIDSLKKMIVQMLEFAAFSAILSFIFPGAGGFMSIFSGMSGLTSLATPVTSSGGGSSNRSTMSKISGRSSSAGRGLTVNVVGKIGNDAIYLSGAKHLSMKNASNY